MLIQSCRCRILLMKSKTNGRMYIQFRALYTREIRCEPRPSQDKELRCLCRVPGCIHCLPPSYPHNCSLIALPDPPTVCHVTDVRIITITKYTDN